MDFIIKQLSDIKNELYKPFPYDDTNRIQDDYRKQFLNLSDDEDSLTGDFNTYCMNIAGTLSYVLKGKSTKIPRGQIDLLKKSFFELFPHYKFFEDEIHTYKDFYEGYKNYEVARQLLLRLVK